LATRHSAIAARMMKLDQHALQYLTNIAIDSNRAGARVGVVLRFARNPLFFNRSLFRELLPDRSDSLAPAASAIVWRPGVVPQMPAAASAAATIGRKRDAAEALGVDIDPDEDPDESMLGVFCRFGASADSTALAAAFAQLATDPGAFAAIPALPTPPLPPPLFAGTFEPPRTPQARPIPPAPLSRPQPLADQYARARFVQPAPQRSVPLPPPPRPQPPPLPVLPSPPPPPQPSQLPFMGARQRRCGVCREVGHFAPRCPLRLALEAESDARAAAAAAAPAPPPAPPVVPIRLPPPPAPRTPARPNDVLSPVAAIQNALQALTASQRRPEDSMH
jgi:hypothetical protein